MATSTPPAGPTNLGVAPNVGGLLCYLPCCIGFIFSIVVVIVEKQSRFLRFHAATFVVFFSLWFLSVILGIIHLGALSIILFPIQMLLFVAAIALQIYLMVNAYNNEEYELPNLGKMARQWA